MSTSMNTIGIALMWCMVQVTLLGFLTAGLYLLVRWLRPAAAASVVLCSMTTVVVLSLLALSPWPRWTIHQSSPLPLGEAQGVRAAGPDISSLPATRRSVPDNGQEVRVGRDDAASVRSQPSSAAIAWQLLLDELSKPKSTVATDAWRWPAVVAVLLLAAMALGLAWLLLGVAAVRRQRLRSRAVLDGPMLSLVEVLRAELGCRRPVEVRQSDDLGTAATIGWRRPVVLLPADWIVWTADQRRAVLAHEIAHARSHDFLALLCGQLGLVLHFYHPLLHWLMNRLRLEQELAADAAAASVSGGQRHYLTAIAELALHQQNGPLLWPARAFLPTRTTFLRRITMLRDSKLRFDRLSPAARLATIGVVLLCGLFVAGLRGPAGQPQALANDAAEPQTKASDDATIAYAGVCHDDQGRPIAGAEVLLYRVDIPVSHTQERLQSVQTADDGKFRFAPVANLAIEEPRARRFPGWAPYRIIATAEGKATEVKWIPQSRVDPEHIDFRMSEGAVLYGTVWSHNGPVKGACVWSMNSLLLEPVPGIECAITDGSGLFQIRDLRRMDPPDGPITSEGIMTYDTGIPLYVHASGFADTFVKYSKVPGTVVVEMELAAVVEGRVVYAENEQPAAGVLVRCVGRVNRAGGGVVRTDADGRYRLDSLGYGKYNIWAEKDGYTMRAIDSLEAIPETTKTAADLRLVCGGFIVGRVVDAETGRPVYPSDTELPPWVVPCAAMVGPARPRGGGAYEEAPIQKDGSFRLRAAPGSNNLYLQISERFFEAVPPSMDVEVAEGQTVTIDYKVRRKTAANEPREDRSH